MPKFKVGDKVRLVIDGAKHSDYCADLGCDLHEGDITSKTGVVLTVIIDNVMAGNSPLFEVMAVSVDIGKEDGDCCYELKTGKTRMRYMWEEKYLFPAEKISA